MVPKALAQFFTDHPRIALAFSGGTDSSYLLYAALKCGCDVRAYYIRSQFQPEFEFLDAKRLAEELNADLCVIDMDALSQPGVAENPADRCYFCKRALFTHLSERAALDGYPMLIDGTNASDDAGDRPGMRALRELQVASPLRECGITKDMVRVFSREAGLFTWDKPAYACLATRVPTGRKIDAETLRKVERAENALFALGFADFRARVIPTGVKLQMKADQMAEAIEKRGEILAALSQDFSDIYLDLRDR